MDEYGLTDNYVFKNSDSETLKIIKKNINSFLKEFNQTLEHDICLTRFDEDNNDFVFEFSGNKSELDLMIIRIGNIEDDSYPCLLIDDEIYYKSETVNKLFEFISENIDDISEELESLYEEYSLYEDDEYDEEDDEYDDEYDDEF